MPVIINIEMPKSCDACIYYSEIRDDSGDYLWSCDLNCDVTPHLDSYYYYEKRHPDCPLSELPQSATGPWIPIAEMPESLKGGRKVLVKRGERIHLARLSFDDYSHYAEILEGSI